MSDEVLAALSETTDESIARWREDAERYRWLREQQAARCWPQVVDGLRRIGGEELDAAIDRAMRVESPRRAAPVPVAMPLSLLLN